MNRTRLLIGTSLIATSLILVLISVQDSGQKMRDVTEYSMAAAWPSDVEDNVVDEVLLNVTSRVLKSQAQRLKLLKAYCSLKKRRSTKLNHPFIVNSKLRVMYCPIGKVASTSWIAVLKQAVGDYSKGRHSKRLKGLKKVKAGQRSYFKFMFVRHPFDRLVSAYKNKFQEKSEYIKELAPKIIQLYRSKSARYSDPKTVTFPEFVSYLVDRRNQPLKDFHWSPQVYICPPCGGRIGSGNVQVDFLGHYETLYDDTDYIIDRLDIDPKSSMPLGLRHRNVSRLFSWQHRVRSAFASIPNEHKSRLKQIYRVDFQAFGFSSDVI